MTTRCLDCGLRTKGSRCANCVRIREARRYAEPHRRAHGSHRHDKLAAYVYRARRAKTTARPAG